ncbi:hypothetical protein CFP56_017884 [Quercus suber]|uniref:Uncharacterized protein n=1 Tax=Quercus suber TaxID=58331 RepID=A0AAW0KMB3_QUESU
MYIHRICSGIHSNEDLHDPQISHLFFSSHLPLFLSISFSIFVPAGTILRTTKQEVLASLQRSHETTPTSSSSQLFLTSPSGQYAVYLLRETSNGAGGFGSDFCYIQVQESSVIIWVSKCASISNINTCSLPSSGFNQPFSSTNQLLSGFDQPFSSQNQPFGTNNQQGLVGNTPFW